MKKCFIYHRVSHDQQLGGSGLARQAELLNTYLMRTSLCAGMDDPEPVIITESGGVSAFKGHNMLINSGLGAWMEEVRAGMWNGSHLVYENGDRFSRQNPFTVIGYINDLINHNITIHDATMNIIISRENSAMLPMVLMNAQRAYDESKFKSTRIRKGWAKKRDDAFKNGSIVTNKSPQWIDVVDNKYVLNDKVAVVREIFRLYQTGIGTPTIAKILNERGQEWLFASGRLWRGESVHKILRNKRVTGTIFISEIIRDYNNTSNPVDQKKYEMEVYPIVISKKEFELVQHLLRSSRPNAGRITTAKDSNELKKSNVFNSICRCARCGEAMYHNVVHAKRNSKMKGKFVEEYRYIRCVGERDNLCENKALRYEVVEKFLIEHIKCMDFTQVLKPYKVNSEVELIRLKVEEEKNHIQEYQIGIERLRTAGKKIPFDVLVELEEAQNKLKEFEEHQSTFTEVQVDIDYLKSVDPAVLFDQTNIEVRARIEIELSKILSRIILYRNGKHYVITIEYKHAEVLKHVLFIEAKKIPVMISGVCIERLGNTLTYSTPSFSITVVNDEAPSLVMAEYEPLSILDYSLLLNYVDSVDSNDAVGVWMRERFNTLTE